MSHPLKRRIDALTGQIGAECPICCHLSPETVIVRGHQAAPDPPRCPACGQDRAVTLIELRRVERDDRRPA